MRRLIAIVALLLSPALAQAAPPAAAPPPATPPAASAPLKGLWLLTDYPSQTLRAGEVTTIRFKLQNAGTAPEAVQLSVSGTPAGWKAEILGSGQAVAAAMPGVNESVALQLRVDVPKDAKPGSQDFVLHAKGAKQSIDLPLPTVQLLRNQQPV